MTPPPGIRWNATDRRAWPVHDGIGHDSLQGHREAQGLRFVPGRRNRVSAPCVDLCAAADGARERQLLRGAEFVVITENAGWAFGFASATGYCGWIDCAQLAAAPSSSVSHWVCAPATHFYPEPSMKSRECGALSMGAQLDVEETVSGFVRCGLGFVPEQHVRPLGDWAKDPVHMARGFLGVPYLWGGNTHAGLDCSGLVATAFAACGLDLPGDSDQQEALAGREIELTPTQDESRAGDLIFWKGHVGIISAPHRLLHANAHHMAVVEEDLWGAIERIAAKGDTVRRVLRLELGG